MAALDPRSPLVFDTRDLGRRPGSMLEVSRVIEAPADFGTAVVAVPEGQPLTVELRLESVVEGVLVTGAVRADAIGACVRCLDPVDVPVDARFQELFAYVDRLDHHRSVGDEEADEELRVTQWCLLCHSSRCVTRTVRGCARNAVHTSPTIRATTTT